MQSLAPYAKHADVAELHAPEQLKQVVLLFSSAFAMLGESATAVPIRTVPSVKSPIPMTSTALEYMVAGFLIV